MNNLGVKLSSFILGRGNATISCGTAISIETAIYI